MPIDGVFRDNQHEILDYLLNDETAIESTKGNPYLTVTNENVSRLLHQAIVFKADQTFLVLFNHILKRQDLHIDYANILAVALTMSNFNKNMRWRLTMKMHCDFDEKDSPISVKEEENRFNSIIIEKLVC